MNSNLFVDFDNIGDNIHWNTAYGQYEQNIDQFETIIYHMSKKYKIDFVTSRDAILYEMVFLQRNSGNVNSFHSNKLKKWSVIYFLTFCSLIFSSFISLIASLFEKECKKDVLFEELWEVRSLYDRFYKHIEKYIQPASRSALLYVTPSILIKKAFSKKVDKYDGEIFNRKYRNIIYDFKTIFNVVKNDFSFLFKLFVLSKESNLNLIYLYLRFLRKYLTYSSQVSKVKAKVLISAADYYWNPIKYFTYKKSIDNIFLIQHNYKSTQMWNRLLEYCDVHFTHSEDASAKLIGTSFSEKNSVGSFQLIPFLEEHKLEYDILFINQTVYDNLLSSTPTLDQKKLIEQHDVLIKNFKQYLLNHVNKKVIFIAKGTDDEDGYMSKKPAIDIKKDFKSLKNIKFVSSYGPSTFDLVKKSKLIINMYSSVGFESYGLDKRVLWINYENSCSVLGFDIEKEDLHVIINDSSYEAFEKRIDLLLSDSKYVEQHYKNLKEKYMNIKGNPAKIIADKINKLIVEDE